MSHLWLLGTEPRPSLQEQQVLTAKPSVQPLCFLQRQGLRSLRLALKYWSSCLSLPLEFISEQFLNTFLSLFIFVCLLLPVLYGCTLGLWASQSLVIGSLSCCWPQDKLNTGSLPLQVLFWANISLSISCNQDRMQIQGFWLSWCSHFSSRSLQNNFLHQRL